MHKFFALLALACLPSLTRAQSVQMNGTVTLFGQTTVASGTPAAPPFQFTAPLSQPVGVVGVAYTSNACATINGKAPITYATNLTIAGLSFSTSTCQYTGTPSTAGNYVATITATDSSGSPLHATINSTIGITAAPIAGGGHNENCNSLNQWIGPATLTAPNGAVFNAPQACVNTAMSNTPSPGSVVNVAANSCSALQTAISTAVCGNTYVIPAIGSAIVNNNTDSLLNTQSPVTNTYTAGGSQNNGIVGTNKWLMFPDAFGINTGTGTIVQTYNGSGSINTAVSLSGIPTGGVVAFPFTLIGCDPFSNCYNGQYPSALWPVALGTPVNVDINYALTGTITGRDTDLLFDEWLCNSHNPTNSNQCLEIEVLPYYSFVNFGGGTFIRTWTEPATVNGAPGTLSFDEYKGGTNILFYPHTMPGVASQEIAFNLMDLVAEGANTWGDPQYQWLTGIELGSEMGAAASQSYNLAITKYAANLGSLSNQNVYVGCRIQPAAVCDTAHYITVRTDQLAALPPEGGRVSPAYVGIPSLHLACPAGETATECGRPPYSQPATPGVYMPKIVAGPTQNFAVDFQTGAAGWRFIGIEATTASGATAAQVVSAASNNNHIIWDRGLIHGGNSPNWQSRDQIQGGIAYNGCQTCAVIDSYVGDIHTGGGKQAIALSAGGNSVNQTGPLKYTNNFVESSGEVAFSGGAGGIGLTILPSQDVEFRLNHLWKPQFWKAGSQSYFGTNFELDNCLELKNSLRWWIQANIFEHSTGFQGTQQGNCIIIGPRNQSNGFSGSANMDINGNVTKVSGNTAFSALQTDPNCPPPPGFSGGHCMFVIGNKAYEVATVIDGTHLTLQNCAGGCGNAGGTPAGTLPLTSPLSNVAFTAALPGLNPNAVDDDIIFKDNWINGSGRVGAIALAPSNNGDLAKELKRVLWTNNAYSWIDGWYWDNFSAGACCVWATGIQLAPATSTLFPDNIAIYHNTGIQYLTGGNPGIGPDFMWGVPKAGQMTSIYIADNVGPGGFASGDTAQHLFQGMAQLSGRCMDHNYFVTTVNPFGPNGKGNFNTADNQPYPAPADSTCPWTKVGNFNVADYNAVKFVQSTLPITNFQLQATSPLHNAASDGTDVGVNNTTLQNAIAGVP